jgi:hypothetical protein
VIRWRIDTPSGRRLPALAAVESVLLIPLFTLMVVAKHDDVRTFHREQIATAEILERLRASSRSHRRLPFSGAPLGRASDATTVLLGRTERLQLKPQALGRSG